MIVMLILQTHIKINYQTMHTHYQKAHTISELIINSGSYNGLA